MVPCRESLRGRAIRESRRPNQSDYAVAATVVMAAFWKNDYSSSRVVVDPHPAKNLRFAHLAKRIESMAPLASGLRRTPEPTRLRRLLLLVASIGSVVACKPTSVDVSPLVDARLNELGLAPSPSASSDPRVLPKLPAVAKVEDPATESLRFLAKLDRLMNDYVPDTPVVSDPSDVLRCVTSLVLQKDEKLKSANQTLSRKREAIVKERQKRLRALYALSFRVDQEWATKKRIEPPVFGCCDDDGSNCEKWPAGADSCAYEGGLWRAMTAPGPDKFVYTDSTEPPAAAPELMARVTKAGLVLPDRFTCRIADVTIEKMSALVLGKAPTDPYVPTTASFGVVDCVSERGMQVIVRLTGDMPQLSAGDLVSVPFANTQRPEGVLLKTAGERELRWTVDAVAETVRVEQRAQCATTEEILAAAKRK
jgi:hypothetical protein